MTEHDFEILRNLLQDSFENNDETLSCFDYLEDYFSPDCEAWKVMFNESLSPENCKDFIALKNNFEERFKIELIYQDFRAKQNFHEATRDHIASCAFYNIKKCYLKVRELIQDNTEYSSKQKDTYIVLMATGLLSAVTKVSTTYNFSDFFIKSNFAEFVLKDRKIAIEPIYGQALCIAYPDMFTPNENQAVDDVDECLQKQILEAKNNEITSFEQNILSEEKALTAPKDKRFAEIRKIEEQIKSNNSGSDAFKYTFIIVGFLLLVVLWQHDYNFIIALICAFPSAFFSAMIIALIASNLEENKLRKQFENHQLYKEYMDAKNYLFKYLKQQRCYWEQMSGSTFERKVALIFARSGYKDVDVTSASNDGGIDIYMKDEQNELIAVQCKRYANPVGVGEIRDFYGALTKNNISKGVFVCSGGFTSGAAKFCREVGIQKLELTDIIRMDVSSMGDYDENCIEEFISGMKNMKIVKSFIDSQSRKNNR